MVQGHDKNYEFVRSNCISNRACIIRFTKNNESKMLRNNQTLDDNEKILFIKRKSNIGTSA